PFLKLLNYFENGAKAKATIPNLIYREGEKLIATEFIRYSFHDIPIPDFTDLDLNSCRESLGGELVLPYEPTRGCVYRCSFCIKNPMENGYQTKSYDRIIKELREMKEKYDCERFQFCDHNIACSYQYLDGLVDVFITEGLEIKWRPFMDIRKVDKKLLKKMSQAGCEVIFYGIESGSDRMLEMIHKGQSSKQAAKVLRWTKEAGIKTLVAFMVGYPHEAESDVIRTIKFIKRNREYIDFAVVRYFGILDSNFMSKNPLEYGIRNLRRSLSRYMLEYDEVGGLSWEQKIIQRKKTMRRIMQVLWGK
ncbi:MAG: radical SAM protein, partial [Candidatus Omnitrophica bacterium]|nr:radical SAM protein [Candidatus Omnitrophota bacterium]